MATALELLKTLPALIPEYDGNNEKLDRTLAALRAAKTIITEANKPIAIQLIVSRFEGKAKLAVGDNPASMDEIIKALELKCRQVISPETIVAKLNATKQSGDATKYVEQMEKLTLQLERAYISNSIPTTVAEKMAVQAGIKALAAGVKNAETKILLKVGQFPTMASAVEKVLENENQGTASVLAFRTEHNNRQNSYNRNRNQNRQYNDNNNRRNNQRDDNNYRNGNNNYRNGNSIYRNRNGQRNYGQNNGNRSNNNSNQNRNQGSQIYYASSENSPLPQQHSVGGQDNGHQQAQSACPPPSK
ncbi:probable cyclin-dependent serine/threonine-protein kinase DDB_G0292550 [Anopheles darlingi]|uniref:probable cyclin-dependent serine/threonine-protein kinase DDB_G0292550 n=1 Tax=Anopheles darlingi TaxID=43151 RepID=UPI0021002015|nr:probable cyclin-dependent serine/threonine-protein kinase DDB_G0292550 [Anopheles darlingi]